MSQISVAPAPQILHASRRIFSGPIARAVNRSIWADLQEERVSEEQGFPFNPQHACGSWWGTMAYDDGAISMQAYAEHLAVSPDVIEEAAA